MPYDFIGGPVGGQKHHARMALFPRHLNRAYISAFLALDKCLTRTAAAGLLISYSLKIIGVSSGIGKGYLLTFIKLVE